MNNLVTRPWLNLSRKMKFAGAGVAASVLLEANSVQIISLVAAAIARGVDLAAPGLGLALEPAIHALVAAALPFIMGYLARDRAEV